MPNFPPIVLGIAFAAVVVAVTALARRLPVPPPILQVAAGFLVGLMPGVAIPELDPDLVFFVFLPPVLWAAAIFTSLREFSAKRRLDRAARDRARARDDGGGRDRGARALAGHAMGGGGRARRDRLAARRGRGDGDRVAPAGAAPRDRDPRGGEPRQRRVGARPLSHGGRRGGDGGVQLGRVDRPLLHRRRRRRAVGVLVAWLVDAGAALVARRAGGDAAHAGGAVRRVARRGGDARVGGARVRGGRNVPAAAFLRARSRRCRGCRTGRCGISSCSC